MKTLYLDLGMGAAGDMLTAALTELLPDPEGFIAKLNAVGIPGAEYIREPSVKCGIAGTHIRVRINGEEEGAPHTHEHAHPAEEHPHTHTHGGHEHHRHGSVGEIAHIVNDHLRLPEKIKAQIMDVYSILAEAESRVHGVPVTDIHFHEIGTMDALADITAVCMLLDEIAPDQIVASPVHVGAGTVKCAHGTVPVPAPATAEILKGIPAYGGGIRGELCTPTGAALLKRFVASFGEMPVMAAERIGYGMGAKDFETVNCVRAILGETKQVKHKIIGLSCNVDDMTAEEIGFATEMLFAAGANEVFTVPIGMKKNRPGTLICVLCEEARKTDMTEAIFKHTSTLGIRESVMERHVLARETVTAETEYGTVRRKNAQGYGVYRSKAEYDDLARIAKEKGISLREARALADDE